MHMRNERGSALLFVMIIGFLVAAFAMTTVHSARSSLNNSSKHRVEVSVFNIAEAGREHGFSKLVNESFIPVPGSAIDVIDETGFGGGTYAVRCSTASDKSTLWLISKGAYSGKEKRIELTCKIDGCISGHAHWDGTGSGGGCDTNDYSETYVVEVDEKSVKFEDAGEGLGEDGKAQIDTFRIETDGAGSIVTVKTKAATSNDIYTLDGVGDSYADALGFKTTIVDISGNTYTVIIESLSPPHALSHVEFTFENDVLTPVDNYNFTRTWRTNCTGGSCGGLNFTIIAWREI
jgi:Tfp pilus assembly protein PilX